MIVKVSAAVSLDGYLDDTSSRRLKLSGAEDWDDVAQLRARCDVILVGAGTLRSDNPSLVIRDEELRRMRIPHGHPADIAKATVTHTGDLDPQAAFFTEGAGAKYVFAAEGADPGKLAKLSRLAEIIHTPRITPQVIVRELEARGHDTLLVEGGTGILTMFFEAGKVDEFRLAVAPLFVGEPDAPRLVHGGKFPWNKDRRMKLEGVRMLGDVAVMDYKLTDS